MIRFQDVQERARESIVFALKEQKFFEDVVAKVVAPKQERAPTFVPQPPQQPVDLDAALDEFINRYPKTLDYLAK